MGTNRAAILAQAQRRERDRSSRPGRIFAICIAAARLLAGAALVLGIVYALSWVGILTAWYLG
jgi:hypothetical protein